MEMQWLRANVFPAPAKTLSDKHIGVDSCGALRLGMCLTDFQQQFFQLTSEPHEVCNSRLYI